MTLKVGDKLPSVNLAVKGKDELEFINSDEIFKGKKVVLFALPGAFTPTCSAAHLPGFVVHHDAIKAKGVDTIACLSVNDAWVMDAWGKSQNVDDNILMLSDGNCEFTRAIGLEVDLSVRNYGIRSQRYSMIVEDGVVTRLNVEDGPAFEVSNAETILEQL
ncbi:MAG: peroxiredoxin [Gammaproteobacteria bacterium]|jgi:peroxiredoxin